MDANNLVKNTLDQIPQPNADARRIVGLVKEGGRITGYQLSDETFVSKPQAVSMAKQGQIAGVGIAHRGIPSTSSPSPMETKMTIWGTCPRFLPTKPHE